MYKALARPHLDYCDITFEEIYYSSFHQKLELFQYNSCAAITGAIRVTSKALPRIRFRVPSTRALVQQTKLVLQDFLK